MEKLTFSDLVSQAIQGDAKAQCELGYRIETGMDEGVKIDWDIAVTWYQKAASQGLGLAFTRLENLKKLDFKPAEACLDELYKKTSSKTVDKPSSPASVSTSVIWSQSPSSMPDMQSMLGCSRKATHG